LLAVQRTVAKCLHDCDFALWVVLENDKNQMRLY